MRLIVLNRGQKGSSSVLVIEILALSYMALIIRDLCESKNVSPQTKFHLLTNMFFVADIMSCKVKHIRLLQICAVATKQFAFVKSTVFHLLILLDA